MSEELPDNEV